MDIRDRGLRTFLRDRSGNIGIMAAASTALVIGVLALGVDYGHLTLQRRSLQHTSDLAAIAAAANLDKAEAAALAYFSDNGKRLAVRNGDRLMTASGDLSLSALAMHNDVDGYAEIVKGRYSADPAIPPENRFVAGAMPYNAAKVTTTARGDLFFARSLAARPDITVKSVASASEQAAFSIGSRLASLNDGVLNKVLGALLGTDITFSAMDYRALLDADVDLFAFSEALASRLKLTGATYDDLLRSEIRLGDFIEALGGTRGLSPSVAALLNGMGRSLGSTQARIRLDRLMSLEPYKALAIGRSDGLRAEASVFDLLNAAAGIANSGRQISVDLGAAVPGLAAVKLDLAIGEPPAGTPFLAVGQEGSIVRTAQTRVKLTASIDGLAALAGLRIAVPLYVEVANAEAALSAITCMGGTPANASVKIKAVPGVAEIALGTVDSAAFNHFASPPRVTKAMLVDSALLRIAAIGHAYAANLTPGTVVFSPQDIQANRTRSVSTRDTLTSLTGSLLRNLDLDLKVLILTVGTPTAIRTALADTLATLTEPLDIVLYNTLLTLGIRIGETDIRVTGVSCQRPVLVQ